MRTFPRLLYNPFDPAMRVDPYPCYRRLRELGPVHRSPLGLAVLSRYRDVVTVQKDPRFGHMSERDLGPVLAASEDWIESLPALARRALIIADPPRHRRFRALMGRCLAPRAVETVRDRVRAAVGRVLDSLPVSGPVELAEGFARKLPVAVLAEAFDLPPEHQDHYLAVAVGISRFLESALDLRTVEELSEPVLGCERCLLQVVAQRRDRPGNDLLSILVQSEFEGRAASDEELVSYVSVALGATYETSSNLVGNSLLALIQHPDQLQLVRREPGLLVDGIEELLRYDSPVQLVWRWALEDVEIHGVRIPRGTKVVLLIGSANRDPDQFPDADRLDLTRADVRHAAFGLGAHYCLGAWLARLEAQVAIPMLLARYGRLGPVLEGPAWDEEHLAMHGVRRLVVDTGPS